LTTFYFIPHLGSQTSFLVTVVVLYILAASGLFRFHKVYAAVALVLGFAAVAIAPAPTRTEYVYQGESEYNVITVATAYDRHLLLLNDNLGIQSVSLNPQTHLAEHFYTDYFLFPNMLRDARRTLILGNAAGTTMTTLSHYFDGEIDGVEIDPLITRLGQRYFGLDLNDEKLNVIHQDGRLFLNHNRTVYDVIAIDMYGGGPYIPFHVATLEFFRHVADALSEDGIMVLNLPFFAGQTQLEQYYLNTIGRVFDSAFRFRQVLYAFKQQVRQQDIIAAIDRRTLPPVLTELAQKILDELEPVPLTREGALFTDDYAPLEKLTFDAIDKQWLARERTNRKQWVGY
jgi:spermidine synthase